MTCGWQAIINQHDAWQGRIGQQWPTRYVLVVDYQRRGRLDKI